MKKRMLAALLLLVLLLGMIPTVLADGRIFEINAKVTMNSRGYTVVSWDDSEGMAPYTVSYEYVDESRSVKQVRWCSAQNLTTKSHAIVGLIPGKTYRIIVFDRNKYSTSRLITVPTKADISSTRKRKETITPMYSRNGASPKKLKNMSASAMQRNMAKGYGYGIEYSTEFYSAASKEIVHDALFAFYAPNGYVDTNYAADFTLPKKANMRYYYTFLGSSFFDGLLQLNGSIPTGTYRFEIYLEGRLFCSKTFKVAK
ncbi:MAG: fibronectin type III domain-containing protein [Clostridia bacterium]|nr:fibronectin type III domain-containing protein [Clostridia bacterium]